MNVYSCYCSDVNCARYGCRRFRQDIDASYVRRFILSQQKGCVCPAGAEKTCERSDCGRKDAPSISAGIPKGR